MAHRHWARPALVAEPRVSAAAIAMRRDVEVHRSDLPQPYRDWAPLGADVPSKGGSQTSCGLAGDVQLARKRGRPLAGLATQARHFPLLRLPHSRSPCPRLRNPSALPYFLRCYLPYAVRPLRRACPSIRWLPGGEAPTITTDKIGSMTQPHGRFWILVVTRNPRIARALRRRKLRGERIVADAEHVVARLLCDRRDFL